MTVKIVSDSDLKSCLQNVQFYIEKFPIKCVFPKRQLSIIEEAFRNLEQIDFVNWNIIKSIRKKVKQIKNSNAEIKEIYVLFKSDLIKTEKQRRGSVETLFGEPNDVVELFNDLKVSKEQGLKAIEQEFFDLAQYDFIKSDTDSDLEEDDFVDVKPKAERLPPKDPDEQDQILNILKRVSPNFEKVTEEHYAAVETRQHQINEIISNVISDFGPFIINIFPNVMNRILNNPSKLNELTSDISAMSSLSTFFSQKEINEFNRLNQKHLPTYLSESLNLLKIYFENKIVGEALLRKAMSLITPAFFKKTNPDITLKKTLTLAILNGINTFASDLNLTRSHSFQDSSTFLYYMHELYMQRYQLPVFDKDYKQESTHQFLRRDLKVLLKYFVKIENDADIYSKCLVAILPHLLEHIIITLNKPHTVYTILVRIAAYFDNPSNDEIDKVDEACKDSIFHDHSQIAPDIQFSIELGEILYALLQETLKLPKLKITNSIVSILESVIKPELIKAAEKIESSLQQTTKSICVFAPIQLLQLFFYDNFKPSEQMIALFTLSEEEKAIHLNKLSDEFHAKFDIKKFIDKKIEESNNSTLTKVVMKKTLPTTTFNSEIQHILNNIANSSEAIHLLIAHIIQSMLYQLQYQTHNENLSSS